MSYCINIFRYSFYTLLYVPLLLIFWLSSPLLVLFREWRLGQINNNTSSAIEPRLPLYLSWAMTPDNSLWGDDGWKKKNPNYRSYWSMVRWLYRNPAYGLATSLLSLSITSSFLWQKRFSFLVPYTSRICLCKFGWQIENPQHGRVMYLLSIRLKSKD